ncbi:hypothetical protein K474DRAFT_1600590 [Panus rudis PR-1116 ss-1]|nr:hypothetical protein K474DRAFT_1600590 [Panus rudis PR-1116 ss-1]
MASRVLDVLKYMKLQKLNLPILLEALSWTDETLISDENARYHRTQLLQSEELPLILRNWHQPPRQHGKGVRTKAAKKAMVTWAASTLSSTIKKEMTALKPLMRNSPCDRASAAAPMFWSLLRQAACTPAQEKKNTYKSPDSTMLLIFGMLSFSRSQQSCKLQKLLTVYFKSCALPTKAFDTLHAVGITMSQKTAYRLVRHLSDTAHKALLRDVESYSVLGCHDNLNIAHKVYEQRLNNQSHFDSGTAASITVLKAPDVVPPDPNAARLKRAEGTQNPITALDIYKMEAEAAPRLHQLYIYEVLRVLFDAPDFSFQSYDGRDDSILNPPPPTEPLPTGPEFRTHHYMLDTMHIDEASYEGNYRVLTSCWRQIGVFTLHDRIKLSTTAILLWVGDQLTVARLRGLKCYRSQDLNSFQRMDFIRELFGWFHLEIAFENSLHKQYYGTRAGFGLVHDFDVLKRKGLHSPSIKGTFHQNLRDALRHIAEARFRNLWTTVGKVKSLNELRKKTPSQLHTIAQSIVDDFASTAALVRHTERPRKRQDDVWYRSVQFNRDILPYLTLDKVLSSGDVGTMKDCLPTLTFRFVGGGNGNYKVEMLETIQGLKREWPEDLQRFITHHGWLVNPSGQPNSFISIDLNEEHDVRNLKDVFGLIGAYATWENIGAMSASIPCQQRVKDHIVQQLNHFSRGKTHTSPAHEPDVQRLQATYETGRIHKMTPGRRLDGTAIAKDFVGIGSATKKLVKAVEKWVKNRTSTYADVENWDTSAD